MKLLNSFNFLLKVWRFKNCFKNKLNDSLEKIFCSSSLDPLDFISKLAQEDNQKYCLAYTLTGKDFKNGAIGAAWTGDIRSNVGICAKQIRSSNSNKVFNTGFVSIINEKSRLTNYQLNLAFAHEIGHSFGAHHDLHNDERCSPSFIKGGHFLMSKALRKQNSLNNIQFSPCSLEQMSLFLNYLINESDRFCFKSILFMNY